ncbi:MAG TPA: right-handed parallel beta-helix repeat-containing protein [Holophagaceae bacterium]|nr:right-handed parallel beta-helix repeat-containing protein [Holophagaceae bacterium]
MRLARGLRCAATFVLLLPAALGGLPAPGSPAPLDVRDPRWGVKADGRSDDTVALQRVLDAAGPGRSVRVPAGVYRVDARVSLRPRSGTTLELAAGAVLKALPNASPRSAVLLLADVADVTVRGGTVEGERAGHRGQGGEWGHGVSVLRSRRVLVEDLTARECWGDGFYISGGQAVVLRRVVADHNRRQGLSVTGVKGLQVLGSTFRRTGGTLPEDGIDLEPNPGETVEDVLIQDCRLLDNAGFGLEIGVPLASTGKAWIRGVRAQSNEVRGNGVRTLSATPRAGIEVSNCEGTRLSGNRVSGNGLGILLRNGANRCVVSGNQVDRNAGDGIHQYLCAGNLIQGNRIWGNAGAALRSPDSWAGGVRDNRLDPPSTDGTQGPPTKR